MASSVVLGDILWRVSAVAGSLSTVIVPLGALAGGVAGDLRDATRVMWIGGGSMLWLVLYSVAVPSLHTLPAPKDAEPYERPASV